MRLRGTDFISGQVPLTEIGEPFSYPINFLYFFGSKTA
jgi:hypothetical protein